MTWPDWRQLHTSGYVVVRDFLSAADVDALSHDFESGVPANKFPFGFKPVGDSAIATVRPRIATALADLRAHTSSTADDINFLTMSHYITSALAERTSFWHQDFDLFYSLTGDHLNYLIFWIPLRKPERTKTNVSVIPYDALEARSPAAHRHFWGNGAHRLISEGGTTVVFGTNGGVIADGARPAPVLELDFDIGELAVTPEVASGDLLLMRGDLIHRTQDTETIRTAASIRAAPATAMITADRVPAVPPPGDRANPAVRLHGQLRECFATGRSAISVRELVELVARPQV